MYYLHFTNGSYVDKTRRKSEAITACRNAISPMDVNILRHGVFIPFYCNLVRTKNIFCNRNLNP